ncbi:MAG: hypothetical protein IJL55_09195 [Lachnospiraceae bacterium]|nr:hypothetical protein [Lachnospiraceae bacterium]
MTKTPFRTKSKLIAVLVIVLTALIICIPQDVQAASGKTVTVSTAKKLKSAMKKSNVGVIIFKTNAYTKLTIKNVKTAKTKRLIIEAPNTDIINKAVFADIEIKEAGSYTEAANGNNISLTGYINGGRENFIIAKKKTVESLKIYSNYFSEPKYTIRKGGKIKNITLIANTEPTLVESSFNSAKRQLTLKYDNEYGYIQSYVIKLDKYSRMTSIKCEAEGAEFDCDYTFKYDSNGNLTESSGDDNMDGPAVTKYTYEGDRLIRSESSGFSESVIEYEYDSKGNLLKEFTHIDDSMDGQPFVVEEIRIYKYDDQGRLIYEKLEDYSNDYMHPELTRGYHYEYEYTYDSKGNRTTKEISD